MCKILNTPEFHEGMTQVCIMKGTGKLEELRLESQSHILPFNK